MSKASLHVFCCPHELINWIRILCVKKELITISFRDSNEFGVISNSIDNLTLQDDTYRIFLFPKSDISQRQLKMNDVKPREWGWVDVRPGSIKQEGDDKVLLLTEIYGEDIDIEPIHPAKSVRWLKRHIKKSLTAGLKGRNIVTGGESVYRDINYTVCALELYKAGGIWKQFVDGRAIFEPL